MARQLTEVLVRAGHDVAAATEFRSLLRDPNDTVTRDELLAASASERMRIAREWDLAGPPDLWLCYHPYYKSPDLIGPPLCREFGVPWVSVEAALSGRRDIGHWQEWQAHVAAAVTDAAVNVALTKRDAEGLVEIVPEARVARLSPFIDVAPWVRCTHRPEPGHLVSIAMMRPGDKTDSYRHLAAALRLLKSTGWRLTILGDGPAREEIEALFGGDLAHQVDFVGEADETAIAAALCSATAYVWPGVGEAFGLAYLEAQAAGVPVVAMRLAGVPEVVRHEETGLLSEPNPPAYAAAIDRVLGDPGLSRQLGETGRRISTRYHSLDAAGAALEAILNKRVWSRDG